VGALRNLLESAFRGIVVSKVVEYLAYKAQYQDVPTRDVIEDYTERIEPELALEL
jgi:transcription elongation factor B subunit 1